MKENEDSLVRYVILLSHAGKPMTESIVRSHVAHLKGLDEKGQLVLCGPFKDYKGGMIVIKAASLEAAREVAENDPFVKEGVETYELRAWELSCKENNHLGMG